MAIENESDSETPSNGKKERQKAYSHAWYEENKAKRLAASRAWYQENKAKHKASKQKWNEEHKEDLTQHKKEYDEKNKDRDRPRKVAYQEANKEKAKARTKKHYEANKERCRPQNRNARLKREYGLSHEDVCAMIESQGSCCLCCKKQFGLLKSNRPNVDHCHRTGLVRGILCHRCNTLLGLAHDSPKILRAGARYLEQMVKKETP